MSEGEEWESRGSEFHSEESTRKKKRINAAEVYMRERERVCLYVQCTL